MPSPITFFNMQNVTPADWNDSVKLLMSEYPDLYKAYKLHNGYALVRNADGECVLFYSPVYRKMGSGLGISGFADLILSLNDIKIRNHFIYYAIYGYEAINTALTGYQIVPAIQKIVTTKFFCENDFSKDPKNFDGHTSECLKESDVLIFHHNHADMSSYLILCKNMADYKALGVKKLLLEVPIELNTLFELFNRTGDERYIEMYFEAYKTIPYFRKEIEYGLRNLMLAAYEQGIACVAVDSAVPKYEQSENDLKQELDARNFIIAKHIVDTIKLFSDKDKAIGLFGFNHYDISDFIRVVSQGKVTSKSYGMISAQFLSEELLYLRKACELINIGPQFHYFAKIPNFMKQKASLLSVQKSLQYGEYISKIVNTFRKICFCCNFSGKKRDRKHNDSDNSNIDNASLPYDNKFKLG